MSDWAKRKWVKSRKAAVERRSSSAVLSEATKARFARLLSHNVADNAESHVNANNLPATSNEAG